MSHVNPDQMFWQQTISRIYKGGNRISVPTSFHARQAKIYELLDNDYTGIVATIIEFMIATGSVNMNFVTDNTKLTKTLQDWSTNKLNKDIHFDIPKGLKALTEQYLRERYRSSFIVLNILWEKIDGLQLPSKMWFVDGGQVIVDGTNETLDGKKYFLSDKDNELKSTTKHTILIRKPFSMWYDDYPTPYLIKRGVLYNAMLKRALINKQSDVIEELIPYLLMIRAGDANLVAKNAMGDIEAQLTKVKDSLKQAKLNRRESGQPGDMILKGRYDLQLDQFIPDLTKILNTSIIEPINYDLLAGLGMIELQGFSSNRQEAILNPKVLIEEIHKGINDAKALYEDVVSIIIERNTSLHPKQMNKDIRIIPEVAKAFLTEDMRKLIKDYTNTGIVSIEDAFEGLPQGFDYEVSKTRRQQEKSNGAEELFFPRVILNQDSNTRPDAGNRPPTPNEVPKKKAEPTDATQEELIAPYLRVSQLPVLVKDNLPLKAQRIWMKAFNSIYYRTKDEVRAIRGAWAAVKRAGYYKKGSGKWVKRKADEIIAIDPSTETNEGGK